MHGFLRTQKGIREKEAETSVFRTRIHPERQHLSPSPFSKFRKGARGKPFQRRTPHIFILLPLHPRQGYARFFKEKAGQKPLKSVLRYALRSPPQAEFNQCTAFCVCKKASGRRRRKRASFAPASTLNANTSPPPHFQSFARGRGGSLFKGGPRYIPSAALICLRAVIIKILADFRRKPLGDGENHPGERGGDNHLSYQHPSHAPLQVRRCPPCGTCDSPSPFPRFLRSFFLKKATVSPHPPPAPDKQKRMLSRPARHPFPMILFCFSDRD